MDKSEISKKVATGAAFQPFGHSIRLTMQAGWHVIHNSESFNDEQVIVPFECAQNIHIDPEFTQTIRLELQEWNIRPATIFGDVNKIADAIRYRLDKAVPEAWELLSDKIKTI